MKQAHLKKLRVVISLLFLTLTAFIFVDFRETLSSETIDKILFLQFVPSLLNFITTMSLVATGFGIILLLSLLFGRVYCSTICPLGILQDVVSFISKKFKKKHKYRYAKPKNILRYSILGITAIVFIFGNVFLLNLLDPFSVFGKIFSVYVRPLYVWLNNLGSAILTSFDVYWLYPVDFKHPNLLTLIYPALILLLVVYLALTKGRLYCNTVCPVGTLLGAVSKASAFKIQMNKQTCTQCGKCAFVCKAQCINIKEMSVDFSRCVACYNCIQVCPEDAISYQLAFKPKEVAIASQPQAQTDTSKRDFLTKSVAYAVGLTGLAKLAKAQQKDIQNVAPTMLHNIKNNYVCPPGSKSIEHFTQTCTACHLCVSVCPTNVLQPSFLEFGFTSMLQPFMDYNTHFCNFECTLCTEICPTGAILPLNKEEKKTCQLGQVQLILENCVVYTEGTACGSCSEHCPTQAVKMVPYKGDLTIPEIDNSICVGCGACEYACPTRPYKAIFVDGNAVHQVAEIPQDEKVEGVSSEEEFPF